MSVVYFATVFWALICLILVPAFTILLLSKTGIREAIIAKAPRIISKLFSCDFCLSFWMSLILACILAIFFKEISILFIPILSTPITRILI